MTGLGDHRGLKCAGCGITVRAKDPALWLEKSGREAVAWHHDCRLAAYAATRNPAPTLDKRDGTG